MTSEIIRLRWSDSLIAALAAWALSGSLCWAAPYLPVTGPVPLREAPPRQTCVLSVNPPLVLEGSNARLRTTSNVPAMTNAMPAAQTPPAVAAEPVEIPEVPPFEYESIITHAGGPPPAEPPVAANVPGAPVPVEPAAAPPLTPQMLVPLILPRTHEGGKRGDPVMVMPVDFQPPEPANPGRSSAKFQSK